MPTSARPRALDLVRALPPSRRALLRTTGVLGTIAPFLRPRVAHASTKKRFVVFYVPEGVPNRDTTGSPDHFWPNPELTTFPVASNPLEPLKSRLTFVRGLGFAKDNADIHFEGPQNLLTGDLTGAPQRQASGITIPGGMSLNLVLAEYLGQGTAHKHYGLGVINYVEGVPAKRWITYRRSGEGVDPQNNPLRAYNDLLANVSRSPETTGPDPALVLARTRLALRRSVLNQVTPELRALRCVLGRDARTKLDGHLDSVRLVETQLEQQIAAAEELARRPRPAAPAVAVTPAHGEQASFWGNRGKVPELGKLQMDIAVAALAADVTRVITLHWNQTVSRQTYPWLPVRDTSREGHSYAHIEDDPQRRGNLMQAMDRALIIQWYVKQFAYFVERLRAIPDGDGNLLDSTVVLYCSEMGNGRHYHADVPFVLAGGRALGFREGRHVNAVANTAGLGNVRNLRHYELTGPTRMRNDLLVAIAQGFGMRDLARFGRDDRNGRPLTEILT